MLLKYAGTGRSLMIYQYIGSRQCVLAARRSTIKDVKTRRKSVGVRGVRSSSVVSARRIFSVPGRQCGELVFTATLAGPAVYGPRTPRAVFDQRLLSRDAAWPSG